MANFILFSLAVVLLLVLLMCVNFFILEKGLAHFSREEVTSYECGFEHNSLSRVPFSVRYFLLTVVFLVFDLEIVLLLFVPGPVAYLSSPSVLLLCLVFVGFLVGGLFYEWVDGSLDWVM